jgi:murein L,D-transpeptidase YafK
MRRLQRRHLGLILSGLGLLAIACWLILRALHWLPYGSPNWADVEARARALCQQHNLPYPPPHRRVVIHKRARKLQLFSGQTLLAEYPIALSARPEGAKQREGDRKVPEGHYFICEKHPSRRFYLFLGLSYPSLADAERGVRQGLIDSHQAQAIRRAIQSGRCPPWNTPLGGAIGLHGGGTGRDWTLGCIALNDADIEILYLLLQIGDSVRIEP